MKNVQLYPLSLSAYYLNFSYPGLLNLQTRVFLSIPFAGQSMEKNHRMDLLEIGFEMNSAFNKHIIPDEKSNVGLKMFIATKQMSFPRKNIKQYLKNEIETDSPTLRNFNFFSSEKELYSSLESILSKFLLDSYGNNWVNFVKESRTKYLNSNLSAYATKEEKDENTYIHQELIKIDKFSEEAQKNLDSLLKASIVDEKLFKQLDISLSSNGSGITSQILGSMPIDERMEVLELNKIIKTFQYYTLSNQLPSKKSPGQKAKKI